MTVLGIGWESENSRQIPKFLDHSASLIGRKKKRRASV
jgi:hypothetical protein